RIARRRRPLSGGPDSAFAVGRLACSGASMQTRRDVDVAATQPGLLEMAGWYLDGTDPRTPHASPVYGDFALMSPLLAVVGGVERWRRCWAWWAGRRCSLTMRFVSCAARARRVSTRRSTSAGACNTCSPSGKACFPEADAAISLIGEWISARTG